MRTLMMIRGANFSMDDSQYVEIVSERKPLPRAALSQAIFEYDDAALRNFQLTKAQFEESLPESLPTTGYVDLETSDRNVERNQSSQAMGRNVYLVIISGPDSGRRFHLPRGTFTIGRRKADICVRDAALPTQAGVVVHSSQGFSVAALSPSEQSNFEDHRRPRALIFGDTFTFGDTTFRLEEDRGEDSAATSRRVGPEPLTSWPPVAVKVAGTGRAMRPFTMLTAAIMPVILGVVLVLVMGSWMFMLFSLMSVVTAGIPAILQLRDRRKLRRQVDAAMAADLKFRQRCAPDWGTLRASLTSREALWPPQNGTTKSVRVPAEKPGQITSKFALPLGTADRLSVSVDVGASQEPLLRWHEHVPAILTLAPGRRTVIRGTESKVEDVARAAVLRLIATSQREQLSVGVLGDGTWLPTIIRAVPRFHYFADVEEFERHCAVSQGNPTVLFISSALYLANEGALVRLGAERSHSPLIIVELDAMSVRGWDTGVEDPLRVSLSLPLGGSAPAYEVLVDKETIRSTARSAQDQGFDGAAEFVRVIFDGLSFETAQVLLEILISEHRSEKDTTASASLKVAREVQLMGASSANSLLVEAGNVVSTHATSAESASLKMIDLVEDGPHLLIAGTTGSGKSEALKSMLWSMVNRYSPDEVSFLHFDFKGGSTLGEFAQLPHTLSVETDLTHADAARMIRGIRAELSRREALFKSHGVADYPAWREMGDREGSETMLARLVIVVDEVRMLLSALPTAMGELATISTIGRSLGVHLILSTQRPLGVISPEIRANIGSSILLRVASVQESQDVLGIADAAHISHKSPGQGLIKTGSSDPVLIQFPAPSGMSESWVVHTYSSMLGPARSSVYITQNIAQESAAELWNRKTRHLSIPSAPLTALPARLPERVTLSHELVAAQAQCGGTGQENLSDLILGISNDLEMGELEPVRWSLRQFPRLGIVAGQDAGAEDLLAALIYQLTSQTVPDRGFERTQVFILDGSLGLIYLNASPLVAGYGSIGDPHSIAEILAWILDAIAADKTALNLNHLIVITGWGSLLTKLGPRDAAVVEQLMAALIRASSTHKVSIVATGSRDLTGTSLFGSLEARIYVPFGLAHELTALWPRMVEVPEIRGRAVLHFPGQADLGREIQCLEADQGFTPTEPEEERDELPTNDRNVSLRELPRFLAKPTTSAGGLTSHSLAQPDSHSKDARRTFTLGITAPTGRHLMWSPGAIGIISGGSGTGKTTLLSHLALQLAEQEGNNHQEGTMHGYLTHGTAAEEDPAQEDLMQEEHRILHQRNHQTWFCADARHFTDRDVQKLSDKNLEILLLDNADELDDALKTEVERRITQGLELIMTTSANFRSVSRLPGAHLRRSEGSEILLSPRNPQDADCFGWHGCPVDPVAGRAIQRIGGSYVRSQTWA